MWGPTLSGYMSLSTPSRTCSQRVSSCMRPGQSRARNLPSHANQQARQLALRVSTDKQTVTVCTQAECYQPVIVSQAAICPPDRSHGARDRKQFITSIPSTNPIEGSIWFSFRCVPRGAHSHHALWMSLSVSSPTRPRLFFCPAAERTTCCPSCPTWPCGASVLSWCLNVRLWRSSFTKGESSWRGGKDVSNKYTK